MDPGLRRVGRVWMLLADCRDDERKDCDVWGRGGADDNEYVRFSFDVLVMAGVPMFRVRLFLRVRVGVLFSSSA